MNKNLIDLILVLLACILIPGCSNNSTEPEDLLKSSISVTGDLTESYDAVAYFGISTFNSNMEEKEYFSLMIIPIAAENPLAMTLLYKSGAESADVGSYQIGKYSFGNDIPEGHFGGSFSAQNADDFSGYSMTSGTLVITKNGSELVSGNFEMSGYYAQFVDEDTTRIINISGKFNARPMPEMSKGMN